MKKLYIIKSILKDWFTSRIFVTLTVISVFVLSFVTMFFVTTKVSSEYLEKAGEGRLLPHCPGQSAVRLCNARLHAQEYQYISRKRPIQAVCPSSPSFQHTYYNIYDLKRRFRSLLYQNIFVSATVNEKRPPARIVYRRCEIGK